MLMTLPPQVPSTPACPQIGSWTLEEPQIERPEHQDNSDVHHQPLPEPVPEEQDVHADHNGYQREHVKYHGRLSSHPSFLLRAAEWSELGVLRHRAPPGAGSIPP